MGSPRDPRDAAAGSVLLRLGLCHRAPQQHQAEVPHTELKSRFKMQIVDYNS